MDFISRTKKEQVMGEFKQKIQETIGGVRHYGDIYSAALAGNSDRVRTMVKHIKTEFDKALEQVLEDYTDIGKVSVVGYTSFEFEDNKIVHLKLTNRYSVNGDLIVKERQGVKVSDSLFESVVFTHSEFYEQVLLDALANVNLGIINQKYAEMTEEAGVSYKVRFVSQLGNFRKILKKLTDDEISFVVNRDIFESTLQLEERLEYGKEKEVEVIRSAQTPQMYLDKRTALLVYITNCSKLTKSKTLIKKLYSKKVENVGTATDIYAYTLDGNTYSAVYVDGEGKQKVVLSPFDLDTMLKVA